MGRLLRAAERYFAYGVSVIPISADGSKRPALRSWKPFQERRAKQAELEGWFALDDVGIAVIGGAISGNLEILDFDEVGLFDQFTEACMDNRLGGIIADMPVVVTPSGGRHLYYRCEEPVSGNTKLARDEEGHTRIETRGEGGYVLAPPSPGACHPSGKPYKYLWFGPDCIPVISGAVRRALHGLASMFDVEWVDAERRGAEELRRRVERGDRRFQRQYGDTPRELLEADPALFLEALMRHGWRMAGRKGENLMLLRPGKQKGCSATWNGRRFYVFSSNAAPFESGRAYNPFGAYGLLEFGGDFSAAARAVRQKMGRAA